ncbi:MAG: phosphatase [Haliscomenobacter sp.]|nr:phosphatase [Haliscomenobacter sp.]MBK7475540.1 phosphatase [Haliscomenobacter sp.]MBK8878839.1 phosphatase [Haliscomenobacter sp.]
MKLAAIDIGSNAIRFQVIRVIRYRDTLSFKKLEYIRFPLRLGQDVFHDGTLSEGTLERFEKLMRAFKILIDLYEVSGYVAVATSAMREAKNAKIALQAVASEVGLSIHVISGEEEAEILSKAIIPFLDNGTYLHIDVGGGSTELNIYRDKVRVDSKSFQMGTVRSLNTKGRSKVFKAAEEWVKTSLSHTEEPVIAVGTGGNIRKLFQLSIFPRSGSITLSELSALQAYVAALPMEERLNLLKLNPDRADVIIPAAEIYIEVMRRGNADRILVPNVGLKDGLLYQLYEKVTGEPISQVEFLDQI